MAVALQVRNLFKRFDTDQGEVRAVEDVTFDVEAGAFFTLLGPSGCGKSTTLRCIAGLERPDDGDITLEDAVLVSSSRGMWTPPHKRPMGMVFQSYAIWPHMNVFDNVAFPLKQGPQKFSNAETQDRVMRSLALVHLDGLEKRPAPQLSGGQQQRLALARALVNEPKALLLDEPLSNLDAKLREEMRNELKLLTSTLGITTLFVTHDQLEALTLSDQVAVMDSGRLVQYGPPREIYEAPRNRFAAEFIGSANFFEGTVTDAVETGGVTGVETEHGVLRCTTAEAVARGTRVAVAVRPENVMLHAGASPAGDDVNVLSGTVRSVVYLGNTLDCAVDVNGALVKADVHPGEPVNESDTVTLSFKVSASRVVPVGVAVAAAEQAG
ncbi:MAG: ABC transporter ATP-binding protein [Chloroflexi bacterium]|nr:ABC transporter ATP-binding protein [Chloroflexota bacterium]MYF65284.1 ABC transporter ATP-binding protein [Chloroflexota bacterium]MYK34554.1 ABC transporter ATP-binding protein [Chloroflexota bacterium]